MALAGTAPALNPAQQAVIDQLGATAGGPRPSFPPDLRDRLVDELEDALAPLVADRAPDDPLVVTKHDLAGAHGCQARWAAESTRFDWSVPLARGTVAHKAVELSLHVRGEPTPLDLVDMATSRLAEGDDSLADWLRTCSDVERAELRAQANDRVTAFVECWPPLQKRWTPVTESRARAELCGGRVHLRGKVDLTLGRSVGAAGKVLVDLKTGGFSPDHLHDLRFYALLETLKVGVPPRRVATYYLDAGRMAPEDVTPGLLDAAVARTVAGVAAMLALRSGAAEPVRRPGPPCWWCPLRKRCPDGEVWMANADEMG
jgi:CRISPR/Cas system-associated exonuclease Cas4 (RecB family)